MEEVVSQAWYLDWKFWSFASSLLAIILSQLPPLKILFRPSKINIEIYNRVLFTHKLGNINARLHLILTNRGRKDIVVKSIKLILRKADGFKIELPAQAYSKSENKEDFIILTPLRLKPDDEWGKFIQFFQVFSRLDERSFRRMESDLRLNILNKRTGLDSKAPDVPADEEKILPIIQFFEQKFCLDVGEYSADIIVQKNDHKEIKKSFRFTLFESDIEFLKEQVNGYKYGYGVMIDGPNNNDLIVNLVEA